jgi:predicted DNA-binding transcriptional regulator
VGKPKSRIDKSTEKAVNEIFKSKAESKIYIYLLRKNGVRSEDVVKGTKLHPSTVRELLSKMYEQKIIHRKKLKHDNIGKKPYIYTAVSPIKLLQKFTKDIENKLNKIANLTGENKHIRIKIIYERIEET